MATVIGLGSCDSPTRPDPTWTLEIDPGELAFTALGESAALTARTLEDGRPLPGSKPDWSSDDPSIATVDSEGLVTSVGTGVTTVRGSFRTASASVTVVVEQIPATITSTPDTARFSALGDTLRVSVAVVDASGAAVQDAVPSFTVTDTTVARVSDDGVVEAVGPGTTELVVAAEPATLVVPVTVMQVVASIVLGVDSVLLPDPGDTLRVAVSAFDHRGMAIADPELAWTSGDPSVAEVDGDGLITATGAGTTRIRALGGSAGDSVDVRVLPELTLEAVGSSTPTGAVDESVTTSVRVTDLAGTPVAGAAVGWSADDGVITSPPAVVSDADGVATGTWRFGTTAGPQTAAASVTTRGAVVELPFTADVVAGPAAVATVLADSVLLSGPGEDARISPTYLDAYGNVASPVPVTWSSSDAAVATVDGQGVVTGVGEGATWVRWSLGPSVDSVLVTLARRGAITVTFDDGWVTTYTNALPVMDEFSLPGNVGVYTEVIGFPAFMDLAQLHDLHDRGWSMVSHTVSHDSLTTLSDADLDTQLSASQQWLVDQGFERGSGVFIAPYHDFGARERAAAGAYYEAARGVSSNAFSPDSLVHWQPEQPLELTGIDAGQLPFTTAAGRDQLRSLLQRVVDQGRFLDVFFHQVPLEDVDAFRETIAVVDEFRGRVVPYHELFPLTVRVVY